MERVFCKDKKNFCECLEDCRKCEFAKGYGVISGYIAHDVLATLFGTDYDLERIAELVQADREGRVNVLPYPKASTCGKCENFARKPGCTYGKCLLNPNRTVYQSRVKCKRYMEGE